ncbi:PPOX class F420-dependent oxidoreductase [Natronomonas sp. EA1]|uniref:PPOX class F420-dependent oxidoreductase n=1 Tax=Natronomonas sp. EA1 TaxID=3421655 RepID=UPI003EB7EE23
MASIPEAFHDLFEKRTFAHVATVMPDGTPQVTPVWVGYDTETGHLLVNTARGRRKERNVAREPKVGLSITDPEDPYRWISVRGVVEELTEAGADEHIDQLAQRYLGEETYPYRDGESGARVLIRIRPESVATS